MSGINGIDGGNVSVVFGSAGASSVDKAGAMQFKAALGKTMAGQGASGPDSAAQKGNAEASLTEMMIMLEQLIIRLQAASDGAKGGRAGKDGASDPGETLADIQKLLKQLMRLLDARSS